MSLILIRVPVMQKEKQIFMKVNYVNSENIHALIELPTSITIEECIKLMKGSSSYYINQNRIVESKFSWGRGYAAFSVSESQAEKIISYIKNQKEHHRVKSFSEEYEEFLSKHHIHLNR